MGEIRDRWPSAATGSHLGYIPRMSDLTLLILIIVGGVLAFALGIWIGLGYPGLYERYESTGKVPRMSPFEMLADWIYEKFRR